MSLLYRCVAFSLVLLLTASVSAAQDPPDSDDSGRIVTSLPSIDPAIHDAMQSRDYGNAVKLIETELDKQKVKSPDYLRYLQGVAQTEAKEYDAALATFEKLETNHPDSLWVSRAKFGRANVFVLRRQYIDAGAIYQEEAERLLSRGRKNDLAKIYLEFADRYFEGQPADDPTMARKPDYRQALTYYSEAIKLGPTIRVRQKIDFRLARCQEEIKGHDNAIKSFERFIRQYGPEPVAGTSAPDSMQVEAHYRLGAVQLAAGQNARARMTWQDLITTWEEKKKGDEADLIEPFLSRAEYRLAHTYGLPQPSSIGNLELAVTVAEKFLSNHPDHELAPKAELEIAQGFSRHNRHKKAVARLQSLIGNKNYRESEQIPVARQMLGQEYLAQGSYDAAIGAWKDFLEKHPTDPKWSEVQKRIVDTEYAKAADARTKKEYADARTLWQTFLNKYPLDPRAPGVLLQFGQMKFAEAVEIHNERIRKAVDKGESAQSIEINDPCKELFKEAIVDWRRVVSKYPNNGEASHASFMIGVTLEDRLRNLKEALESYRKVKGQFASRATQRTKRLTSPQLMVATERKFRSNEKPRIKLTTRNLQNVTVKAYRVDMTDYFRKMHLASGLETLDIALIDPDEQFEYAIEGYEDYQKVDDDIELPIDGPGVTAVTVSSDKLEATTMVVVSDLDMVVKSSRNEIFMFVENMLTGKPVEGVSVLVSDGSEVFAEELTGVDGILQKSFDELKSVSDLRVFAVQEGHMASTVNNLNGLDFAVGLTPRGYLYTDRPAYRSGQLVNIKGIVRWVDQDRFTFKSGEKLKLDVYDARGRQLDTKEVTLNNYGTINSNIILPASAAQGDYRVHLHRISSGENDQTGALSFETKFKVTEYKLEPIQIQVDLDKSIYFRGERVKATIGLEYYYGTPLAGETIQYSFGPDSESVTAKTDDKGKIEVEFETQRFSEAQLLKLTVNYPERNLASEATAYLATRGFAVTASSMRDVFINGESFATLFKVADPAGKPVEAELKVEVFQQTNIHGKSGEKLVQTHEVSTDKERGEAMQTLSLDEGGIYFIRATGVDQFGNEVSGQNQVRISGDKDTTRLRVLADQHYYQVGDEAEINLHWREQPALALVTFEGSSILGYKLISLKTGDNQLKLPMESGFAPNFFLNIAVMQRNQFHATQSEFRVSQQLNVTVKPHSEQLKPGEDLSVDLSVTDPQGNPVKAEVSLAMIQTNLLNRFSDVQGAVSEFFNTGKRTTSVRQSTSCTFSYRPKTRGVSEFLLAEAERRETLEREVRALADLEVGGVEMADEFTGNLGRRFSVDEQLFDADFEFGNSVVIAGQVLEMFGNTNVGGGQGAWGGVTRMRRETRMRTVPVTRYRTETHNGRQVQIPYIENVTQSYSVQVPHTEHVQQQFSSPAFGEGMVGKLRSAYQSQSQQGYRIAQGRMEMDTSTAALPNYSFYVSPRPGVGGPGPGIVSFDVNRNRDWFGNRDVTVNGLTNKGKFLAVNGKDEDTIQKLAMEEGLAILPAMAHAETAFWDPTIITDDAGKASVTITMPSRSTAWRLRVKGINGGTLAGDATADVITKKELFGDLKLPLAFTDGDKATIPVEVHNSLDDKRLIKVTLKTTLGDKSTEESKTIKVNGPGITNVDFKVEIDEADQAKFELTVDDGGDFNDATGRSVIVQPYGFPVFETESGTSSQDTLALIDFDPKLQAEGATLEIVIGSDVNRALLDSVIGSGLSPVFRCGLPTSSPIERGVSDVLGGVELMKMIGDARDADTPQGQALTGRITFAVSQMVSTQNENGGWSWSGNGTDGNPDAYLSSRVMWALSAAREAGFAVSQQQFDKGKAFLKTSFASAAQSNLERQTVLLHSMAVSGCADFSFANRLYRERNRLSPSGLTHLALTLAEMNHKEMAGDLIEMIKIPIDDNEFDANTRQKIMPWMRNRVELRAMYMLALQKVLPAHPDAPQLAKSILSARVGSRWPVEKSNGPAIAALANWHSRAKLESEKYKLTVAVNDRDIETLNIDPSTDGSRRIQVPTELLHNDKPQRIEFELEGRATFSYSAVLTGFVAADKIKSTTPTWTVSRRYEPSQRIFDGRPVPRGFGVVNGGYRSFTNPLTQLPVGERGEVTLSPRRHQTTGRIGEQYDYLVLTEPIPAGCTVLDKSVKGTFERYEIEPGQITFHIGDRRHPGNIRYTLVGYAPGDFQAPQSLLRSFYEPSQFSVATVKALQVLKAGSETVDEYRLTPDELYHIGQKEFEKDNFDTAHEHLTNLYDNWRLDNDKYKNTVHWLFKSSLAKNSHGDTVKFFEVLKEKFPDIELSFEDILRVAKSYRELGEYERSYLVYRATVEGSFERESQVAGFLNARGEFVRSVQAMERLLRDYPAESYVATATYALAQETYRRAPNANADEKLRDAGITRVHLIDGAIEMLDHFVTTWPEDPADDQASFALATALIDLEKYEAAITRSEKYAARYADSRLLDSYWYMVGYSHFELGHPDEALQMCGKVADATFPVPETGGTRRADNRWEAVYIMGQIYHSLGKAGDAIVEYTKVKERFADATEAISFFNRKEISMDEVTTIKPSDPKQVELQYRNVREAAIKVYRIDLMKFGLMQRNLDRITAINLAGIKPYHEETIELGDGKDYRDRNKELVLPLKEEGAYLIVCRGDNLYASGLVLVSPLTLQVQEDETSGRVRVSVKDAVKNSFVSDVHVKVIGSANHEFNSGETDLRGLFIADNVRGTSTVIAVSDEDRYAFYRGTLSLQKIAQQTDASPATADSFGGPAAPGADESAPQSSSGKGALRDNLFNQNGMFQLEQKGNYDGLLNNDRSGIKSKEAY